MKIAAIVGSRDVPLDILELMIRIGRTFTDLGVMISSGDAFGSDRAGWYGAKQSRKYSEVGARIYLTESWRNRKRVELNPFFMIAEDYPETWQQAKVMASSARGNFNGLNDYGIALHTRNVYQIFGHNLDELIRAIVYYAKPVGDVKNEVVKGGTNTAVRLAVNAEVPTRINLYTQEGQDWAYKFLEKWEQDYPYEEIVWREILKPDDPRLVDLE